MLRCELVLTGKIGEYPFPDGGEVVITNTSTWTVDIGSNVGPLGHFDFKVKGPDGADVETTPYGTFLTPAFEPIPYPLKPGESFRTSRGFLCTMPQEGLAAGVYKVKGVFTFQGQSYESPEVEVTWPGGRR